MNRWGTFALSIGGALAVVIPSGLAAAGGAAEITHLYREDANAVFVVPEGDCGPARSQVGVGFHQNFFTTNTAPMVRSVQFGVSIQLFDCAEQFVIGAEGLETFLRPFNIAKFLTSTRIDTTIQACQTFPGPGECFPVEVHLRFRGVGERDVDRSNTDIDEPDCRIIERDWTGVRNAKVSGTISYTLPGQAPQTLHVDSDDLSPAGASLSSASEFQYFKGSSGSCIEITG
jgi:hypothetical protein